MLKKSFLLPLIVAASAVLGGALPASAEAAKDIAALFPQAEIIVSDDVEQQAMITFGKHRFWLALPAAKAPGECKMIFVFSGRGGTGKTSNIGIHAKPFAKKFRQDMLAAGFGFVCADCGGNAWGNLRSTQETLAAAEYCRQHGLNVPEKLNLLGFSMGGLGALMFAIREPDKAACIVDVFGVTNLEELYQKGKYPETLGKLTEAERLARSPILHTENLRHVPILIVHGKKDANIDISHSRKLHETLTREGGNSQLLEIPGYGHDNNILKAAGSEIQSFFRKSK